MVAAKAHASTAFPARLPHDPGRAEGMARVVGPPALSESEKTLEFQQPHRWCTAGHGGPASIEWSGQDWALVSLGAGGSAFASSPSKLSAARSSVSFCMAVTHSSADLKP